MIVFGDELRPWLETALGDPVPANAQFLGCMAGNDITAVVAFHSWIGGDIELSAAAVSGTPGFVAALFDYVFVQLKCTRCTAKARADNAKSLALVKRLGFKLEGRMRQARAGKDVLIFGLLKQEYDYGRRTRRTNTRRSQHGHQRAGTG